MKKKEYLFELGENIHLIQWKVSQNSKIGLGFVIQTYHFSKEQITNLDLKLDKTNCLNCPFSYSSNDARSGKCYTHKGMQRMGLNSMLKRLNVLYMNGAIEAFNLSKFKLFAASIPKVDLCRYGAYGEPSLLPLQVFETFDSYKRTGYTHAWRLFDIGKYLMASVHTDEEMKLAKSKGYRTFRVIEELETVNSNEINCPASKESGKKATCVTCRLCKGFDEKIKDIYILQH
jgi:hypothetical protein